jgi:hypothetical protein
MAKKAAIRLWSGHRARDFDRGTYQPGRHGGALGHTALAVLHALIFAFLNLRTGRLDPSYAAIAHKAGVCVRTVAQRLQPLQRRAGRRRGGIRRVGIALKAGCPLSAHSPLHAALSRTTSPVAVRLARGRPEHTNSRTDRTGFASDWLV